MELNSKYLSKPIPNIKCKAKIEIPSGKSRRSILPGKKKKMMLGQASSKEEEHPWKESTTLLLLFCPLCIADCSRSWAAELCQFSSLLSVHWPTGEWSPWGKPITNGRSNIIDTFPIPFKLCSCYSCLILAVPARYLDLDAFLHLHRNKSIFHSRVTRTIIKMLVRHLDLI